MNRERANNTFTIGSVVKTITVAAFAVATVSVSLPIVAYIKRFPLNLIWPDFVAIALMVVAGYLFRRHREYKNNTTLYLYSCHLMLCMAIVASNIVWVGIPFLDILMLFSATVFGLASFFFLIMLLSTCLWKRMQNKI